jgi:hypothetical protein
MRGGIRGSAIMESDFKYSRSQKQPFSPRVGFDCKKQIIAPLTRRVITCR